MTQTQQLLLNEFKKALANLKGLQAATPEQLKTLQVIALTWAHACRLANVPGDVMRKAKKEIDI